MYVHKLADTPPRLDRLMSQTGSFQYNTRIMYIFIVVLFYKFQGHLNCYYVIRTLHLLVIKKPLLNSTIWITESQIILICGKATVKVNGSEQNTYYNQEYIYV